jgi:uncharacterized repeat protein (TIGR03843 family)
MAPLPNQTQIIDCLNLGIISVEGQFMWGSNYTFLCQVEYQDSTQQAVYKPVRGERPLWDFPSETLSGREVAAFLVSQAGGWDFVPPTVFRHEAPAGPGSLQYYIEHDPEYHYFNFSPEDKARLRPVALFDAVINNTDRKGGHILKDPDDKLWLIDHGVCFHTEPKLRTVIWDFAEQSLTPDETRQLKNLKEMLEQGAPLHKELSDYLSPREIQAMCARIVGLLETNIFPAPTSDRYALPWPPV